MNHMFLVRAEIERSRYQLTPELSERIVDHRIVWAIDERDAFKVYAKYWSDQNEQYSLYHNVISYEVTATIGTP